VFAGTAAAKVFIDEKEGRTFEFGAVKGMNNAAGSGSEAVVFKCMGAQLVKRNTF
jgi:hypothetical protein